MTLSFIVSTNTKLLLFSNDALLLFTTFVVPLCHDSLISNSLMILGSVLFSILHASCLAHKDHGSHHNVMCLPSILTTVPNGMYKAEQNSNKEYRVSRQAGSIGPHARFLTDTDPPGKSISFQAVLATKSPAWTVNECEASKLNPPRHRRCSLAGSHRPAGLPPPQHCGLQRPCPPDPPRPCACPRSFCTTVQKMERRQII